MANITSGAAQGKTERANYTQQALNQGIEARKFLSEDEKKAEGAKSAEIAFIATIGGKKQKRVEAKQAVDSYKPIGYRFKANADLMVPESPLVAKGDAYQTKAPTEWRPVKKGETFDLNLVETAILLSKSEFGGTASGDANLVVSLCASIDQADGDDIIKPYLRVAQGSIKANLITAATEQSGGVSVGGKEAVTYIVKPEFQKKFGLIFERKQVGGVGGLSSKDTKDSAKNWAAYLRTAYTKKGLI